MLTTDQKGNIAEPAIAAAAIELGVDVYRPVGEGGRFDMIFAISDSLLRIQCKWAPRHADTVVVRCYSSRRSRDGILRRPYLDGEIDAFAAYCPDTRVVTSSPQRCAWREERFAFGSLRAGTISL